MEKRRTPSDEPGYRKPRKMPKHELTVRKIEAIHTICLTLDKEDMGHPKVVEAVQDLFENGQGGLLSHAFVQSIKNAGVTIDLRQAKTKRGRSYVD